MSQASKQQRGSTPTSSSTRSPAQAGAAEGRPGRAASKDSLKQKMAKAETSKADEVRFHFFGKQGNKENAIG